jgi:DNA polymerase III subunit delta'
MVLRAAARGQLQRSLLVHGPPGAGKGAFTDDLLALLLCSASEAEDRPCNTCSACRAARSRTHPDLLVGGPRRWRDERNANESIVAAARRWLLQAAGTPVAGDRRVVLIEQADMANEQTQNALLKALEEPGPRQMFVLVADEAGRLLPTVRSRCQPLRVAAVPRAELVAWLVDRERLPADQADVLVRMSDGMAGRAIAFARSPEQVAWRRRVERQLLGLLRRGAAERFGSVRELMEDATPTGRPGGEGAPRDGETAEERTPAAAQREAAILVVDAWLGLARDMMVSAAGRPELATSGELHSDLGSLGQRIGAARIVRFVQLLERVRAALAMNAAPRLSMEVAMLEWPSLEADR